jgi:hypothetical protein
MILLNWEHFQTYNEAATRAFEAMCNQLFELWCRRTYIEKVKSFSVVNGSGGDGGVEAFSILIDDTVVGVQAKWFRESISDSQFNQVKKSVETALQVRPNIIKYIICIPRDLSYEKMGKGKKVVNYTESKRWESLKEELLVRYPKLEIELWNETRLLTELQFPEASGVLRYWFEKAEISEEVITMSFEKQQHGWLKYKYIPDLHCEGIINDKVERFIGVPTCRKEQFDGLTRIGMLYRNLIKQGNEFISIMDNSDGAKQVREVFIKISKQVEEILTNIDLLKNTLKVEGQCTLTGTCSLSWEDLSLILTYLEEKKREIKIHQHVSDFEKAIKCLEDIISMDTLSEIFNQINRQILLIFGDAGTGKTHGIAGLAEKSINEGINPVILIQAKSVLKSDNWRDMTSRALGISSMWSEDEIWQGLEALTYRNEIKHINKRENDEFYIKPKVLICIDGIDESRPYEYWINRINEIEAICKRHPRVKFCVTSRPYIFKDLEFGDHLLNNSVHLSSDGDALVSDLFELYMNHFSININDCGWLKWSIRTPLALRLFSELNKGKEIYTQERPSFTITKLIEKKIEIIDKEFRELCNNDFTSNDYITKRVLLCLNSYFFTNWTITKEKIFKFFSEQDGLTMLTNSHINILIDCLENYGLLQCYVINTNDILSCPTVYYELGVQPIFDYLMGSNLIKQLNNQTLEILPDRIKYNQGALQMASIILLEDYNTLVSENSILRENIDEEILFDLICFALSNVEPKKTNKYIKFIAHLMNQNAGALREVVNKIVLVVSRTEKHPLGPLFLHNFLMNFDCPGSRDIIWSVPDWLFGKKNDRWNCYTKLNLVDNEYKLREEDKGNGLPLVYAWALTIVDNEQRAYYRKELVRWGQSKPEEFYDMFHMIYKTNDPQMKEELFAIAMGVVFSLDSENEIIGRFGELVQTEIFAIGKIENNLNAAVRYYARAMAERAYMCGYINRENILRCRPSYKKSEKLIELNKGATKGTIMSGFGPIDYDLSRYVICDSVKWNFFEQSSQYNENNRTLSMIDYTDYFTEDEIEKALRTESNSLSHKCKEVLNETLKRLKDRETRYSKIIARYKESSSNEEINDKEIESFVEESIEKSNDKQSEHEKMINDFLDIHAWSIGKNSLEPHQFAISACYAYILRMGWNKELFYGYPNGGEPDERLGADLAIRRSHLPATHGRKSSIMSFGEKYVWCALNELFGYLADRLPFLKDDTPQFIDDYGLLNDYINPAQELSQMDPDLLRENCEWYIPEQLNPRIDFQKNTSDDIIKWINNAPIPDFKKWIYLHSDTINKLKYYKKKWISLYGFHSITESTVGVESIMWISSAIINNEDFHYLINDLINKRECVIRQLNNPIDLHSSTKSDVYITPMEICWMNWKEDCNSDFLNATIDEGDIKIYQIDTAVERTTSYYQDYGDIYYELPSKNVRNLLGITDGDGYEYFNREKEIKALYFNTGEAWRDSQSILCVDQEHLFSVLNRENKRIFWIVRLSRLPSIKTLEKGAKKDYRRDRNWIVWFEGNNMKSQLFIDNAQ